MTITELLEKISAICNQEALDAKAKIGKCGNDFLRRQYHIGRKHAASDIWHKIKQLSGDKEGNNE